MPSTSSIILDERYALDERVGVGGFSEVWRAHDRVLDRPVAVKLLRSGYAGHEETLYRFRAEARHAGALSHQNIARVYDYGDPSPEHPPYLVMELIDGDSLARVLRTGGAMDAARAMDIVAQAAVGLQAAHQAGLVHRDVKPANLLLDAAGVVKITDFGISYAAGSASVTRTGMIVGTPSYLAPERASGAQATPASDLYALGVVAYECLTGAPPFAGSAIEVVLAHAGRPLPPLPASVPAAVAGFVECLTAKDPADRPATAAEVAATASHLRDQLRAGQAPTASFTEPPLPAASYDEAPAPTQFLAEPRPRRRPAGRIALGLAGGAVVAALIALAGVNLLGGASAHPRSDSPSTASPVGATRVNVDGQALIGLPVGVAARELRQLHLLVQVRRVMTTAQPRGRVVAVEPTGRRPVGSVITIIAAVRPPHHRGHHRGHGQGHDHGHGDGGGNGGGGGDNGGNGDGGQGD
jgi:hypothetical protein